MERTLQHLRLILGFALALLVMEHALLWWHYQRDQTFLKENRKTQEDLSLCQRMRAAEGHDFDLSLALCGKRNEALVDDLDKCAQEVEDLSHGNCVPTYAFESLVEDQKQWKLEYELMAAELDACRREKP